MHSVRQLTPLEISTTAFRKLLWWAVEVDDDTLDEILRSELPTLTVLGIVESDVVAFIAYQHTDARLTIEYIAVDEACRGRHFGADLIDAVTRTNPTLPVYAQTDDDAVGFYRALGFQVTPRAADSRWPERQRYDCTLNPH